jgi:hypothetical protein
MTGGGFSVDAHLKGGNFPYLVVDKQVIDLSGSKFGTNGTLGPPMPEGLSGPQGDLQCRDVGLEALNMVEFAGNGG